MIIVVDDDLLGADRAVREMVRVEVIDGPRQFIGPPRHPVGLDRERLLEDLCQHAAGVVLGHQVQTVGRVGIDAGVEQPDQVRVRW